MTEFERYLFDLQGFLIIENVLNSEQIKAIQALLDQQIELQDHPGATFLRFDGLLSWGKPYQELIDHPQITPYLSELLGEQFRLDHDYIHIIRQGIGPIGAHLHGGGTPYDPCQYYLFQNGRMYNGLTTVAYELNDVHPGDGGFGCIPGSHKSNLPLPQKWKNLEFPCECVQAISVKAGSAIIFTEALTHGTLPWRGLGDRQTLFYKYSPYSSAWARYYYNLDDYPNLTASQQKILRTPGVFP
ncbi:phytanoyl-CoA dioxygenase family protein [Nostocaceae cyanobacterium CENA357]|uniref:Phytanoyl-CoA dioxygenase family protein n=1 Tax=Atlanticothrix silvestris CENA357 TaxID=1725252 RepID=A0A8J7HH61_9CYAN|nr:phytanoyl-CoA dioxygenase family protein [Atlanticothrix silvestris]MBH8555104.1 phytanoyl-CoA dioxygenase family protein [Atlanticothrix silvestris CENA357]